MLLEMGRASSCPATTSRRISRPRYNPWDQRVCLVPDGDLFTAIRAGKVSVVTGTIDRFTETGIRLESGEELEADIVVTATGLVVRMLGGIALTVDGAPVNVADRFSYKGMMLERRAEPAFCRSATPTPPGR